MRKTFFLPVAATAAGGGTPPANGVDNIEYSVRFNSADSAYLSRTPSSAGNQRTFTLSFWYKRSILGTTQGIISTDSASFTVKADTDFLQTQISAGGYDIVWQTGAVFRDPSAWYHVVVLVDTTQSTAANAVTLYVNNVQQTLTTTTNSGSYTANVDTGFNGTGAQSIGRGYTGTVFYYSDHYLANIHNVDGQALTPSSFGLTDSNGVWQPKAYTGDYGTEDYPGATTDSSGSFFSGRGPENLFDGSTSTLCDPALQSGVITFTPTTGISYSSSVEVYTASGVEVSLNGGAAVTTSATGWNTIDSGSGTISSLSAQNPGFRPNWRAIRVDGKILINSPNGFHLDFADNSSAAALGNDVSGNNNDWTVNNISVTAGSGNDSLVDSPTNYGTDTGAGGEVRGNYATLNPLDDGITGLSNGNLDAASANAYPTIIPGSGQWYYEVNGTGYTWDGTRANWTPRAGSHNFGQRVWASSAPSGYKALCTANLPTGTVTTSGSFTGTGTADGPFIYLNGVPTAMTINSNSVTFGTDADKLSNGFKVRSSSASYNSTGTNTYSITTTGDTFNRSRAQTNP